MYSPKEDIIKQLIDIRSKVSEGPFESAHLVANDEDKIAALLRGLICSKKTN